MPGNDNFTVEGFVTDPAFVDQSKSVNGFLIDGSGQVGSLTNKSLSYFSTPATFTDSRNPTARQVNWVAQSKAQLVIDSTVFSAFVTTVNALPQPAPIGFFEIIDRLLFKYTSGESHATIEAALLADSDIAQIYVPGSYSTSSVILTDKVYTGNTNQNVAVPSFINFSIILPTGSTTTTYNLKLYASVDAWLQGYNHSTIVKVIPPLPYDKLLGASLTASVDNIFATAKLTATLSYNTTQASFGTTPVSGMSEYEAVITDGTNSLKVPFNILYKGRAPTLFEIRNAIKAALLGSGVGTENLWKQRIPGVFVTGRFYLVPLWDQTYTKPDQILYPNISPYKKYLDLTTDILSSLGYGNLTNYIDVLSLYYNHMTATVIPDLSGILGISMLSSVIPDYQDYSPVHEQFGYMLPLTQDFSKQLNEIMAVDSGAQTSVIYTPTTEGLLTFYSYTFGNYEVCVISKLCYETVMGSTQ